MILFWDCPASSFRASLCLRHVSEISQALQPQTVSNSLSTLIIVGLSLKYLLTIHRAGATMEAGRKVNSSETTCVSDKLGQLTEVVQVLCPRADRFEYPQATVPGIACLFRHYGLATTEPLLHFLTGQGARGRSPLVPCAGELPAERSSNVPKKPTSHNMSEEHAYRKSTTGPYSLVSRT